MWSGPRNISTALMRAFENRADTIVVDEPLYAYYLKNTGVDHPGRDGIIAAYDTDYQAVTTYLSEGDPGECGIFYQKQMAHHLQPDDALEWLSALSNVFLIRDPKAMLLSLSKVLPTVTVHDTGLPQQLRLVEFLRNRGEKIVVLDSRKVLENPQQQLQRLCRHLGVAFEDAMLNWPAGPRASDGIWSPYWYDAVLRSTGFSPYTPKHEKLPDTLQDVLAQCESCYQTLRRYDLAGAE
ncbi:MAG: HAD family hydrolase [Gammaproteobacteria bacterium]|nr:HAD family hydrolase [Gammaproteobacteria bacterium]